MIIFFSPGGRLGNLLFQIAYIETIRKPQERIFTTQLKNIKQILPELRRYSNTNSWFLIKVVDHILKPLLIQFFVKTRLFQHIKESNGYLVQKPGLFPIAYLEGYFQSERFLSPSAIERVRLHKNYAIRVAEYFKQAQDRRPVFVHVRRGDYLDTNNVPYLLPLTYYEKAIDDLQNRFHNLYFFFVSDDPDWCEQNFSLDFMTVSRLSPPEDLSLMSLCEGGIISNSTFAWWGARLSKRTLPILAPKYWLKWREKTWFPEGIQSLSAEWRDV